MLKFYTFFFFWGGGGESIGGAGPTRGTGNSNTACNVSRRTAVARSNGNRMTVVSQSSCNLRLNDAMRRLSTGRVVYATNVTPAEYAVFLF